MRALRLGLVIGLIGCAGISPAEMKGREDLAL